MLYKFWKENINSGLVAVDIATKLKLYITHVFFYKLGNIGQLFWAEALLGEFRIICQGACAHCINDHKAQIKDFAKCGHCTVSEFI
jgi:hypothetical protein